MLFVYSKPNCPECTKAKALLDAKGVNYAEIDIVQNPFDREFLLSQGHKSLPQIYQDGGLFVEGGYKGLLKLTDEDFAKLK